MDVQIRGHIPCPAPVASAFQVNHVEKKKKNSAKRNALNNNNKQQKHFGYVLRPPKEISFNFFGGRVGMLVIRKI